MSRGAIKLLHVFSHGVWFFVFDLLHSSFSFKLKTRFGVLDK